MTGTNIEEALQPTIRRTRGRALGFVAGAAFMCVLSAGFGAGAATLITSAQIKDGTIVGRDVKNRSITGRDVKLGNLTGKHVKDGSIDTADVKDGSIDTADLSAAVSAAMVDAVIPSGKTVTGIVNFDVSSNVSGDYAITVDLPGRAASLLSPNLVNFGGDDPRISDDSTECTGTGDVPTAPAGKVCIYLMAATADSGSFVGSNVAGTSSNQAFGVIWNDNASGSSDVFAKFSWAYTAP